jgi:hypothetical protein
MTLTVDFDAILPHGGSKDRGFELLAKLLMAREPGPPTQGARWIPNEAPDGGLEGYWEYRDGAIRGIQAKYFLTAPNSSQWNQVKDSITTARVAYPRLREMVVALPKDLPNQGSKKGSARTKWEKIVEKWRSEGLSLELWSGTTLFELLSRSENNALRTTFFCRDSLDSPRLEELSRAQIEAAKRLDRYSPDVNVDSAPAFLDWLAGDARTASALRRALSDVLDALTELRSVVSKSKSSPSNPEVARTLNETVDLFEKADREGIYSAAATTALEHVSLADLRDMLRRMPQLAGPEQEAISGPAGRILDRLDRLGGLRRDRMQRIGAARVAFVEGEMGTGKTHTICHGVSRLMTAGVPCLLVLGAQLAEGSLTSSLQSRLGTSVRGGLSGLLQQLDVLGEMSGRRGLLILDGLDEARIGLGCCRAELSELIHEVARHRHVAVAVTARTSYWSRLDPDRSTFDEVDFVRLRGFEGSSEEAFERYATHYNVVPHNPLTLDPRFESPLFLRLFFRSLRPSPDPSGVLPPVEIPEGTPAFGELVNRFLKALDNDCAKRERLKGRRSRTPIADIAREFARAAADDEWMSISESSAFEIANAWAESVGSESVVDVLLDVGLVGRIDWGEQGRFSFAYTRMTGYIVADSMIGGARTADEARANLRACRAAAPLFDPSLGRINDSVLVSLLSIWPERFGCELVHSIRESRRSELFASLFFESLSSRADESFTPRAASVARLLARRVDDDTSVACRIRLCLRRAQGFGVRDLHASLLSLPLAHRDARWSAVISHRGEANRVSLALLKRMPATSVHATLVSTRVDRAILVAWLLACTDESVRDDATRRLADLFDSSPVTASRVLEAFSTCDDMWLIERVAMATYGAALRSERRADWACCAELLANAAQSNWVVRHFRLAILTACGSPAPATSVRDRAIDGEVPAWRELEGLFGGPRGGGAHSILASCGKGLGDFGRYVVNSTLRLEHARAEHRERMRRLGIVEDVHLRWIADRAIGLGWTEELHSEIDMELSSDRFRGRAVERLGKKYQWTAWHELLARLNDADPMLFDLESEDDPIRYSGLHYVDTSHTGEDPEPASPPPLAVSIGDPSDEFVVSANDVRWVKSDESIPSPIHSLKLEAVRGRVLLAAWDHISSAPTVHESLRHSSSSREMRVGLSSFVVERDVAATVARELEEAFARQRHIPSPLSIYSVWWGEWPSLAALRVDKSEREEWKSAPFSWSSRGLQTTSALLCGDGTRPDSSTPVDVPSTVVADALALRPSPRIGCFVGADGLDRAWFQRTGESTRLWIDAERLADWLRSDGRAIVFLSWARKLASPGSRTADGLAQRYFSELVCWDGVKWERFPRRADEVHQET